MNTLKEVMSAADDPNVGPLWRDNIADAIRKVWSGAEIYTGLDEKELF